MREMTKGLERKGSPRAPSGGRRLEPALLGAVWGLPRQSETEPPHEPVTPLPGMSAKKATINDLNCFLKGRVSLPLELYAEHP